ncbi:hypothetical protein V8E52_007230 [Russula decolorans]|jgi:hypothetical protein
MQRCKIVTTWILILFIVNFALGAPAAARERLEMSVGVDVAERGTATSQKRYDPLDDWSTTNAADRPPTPARLTSSDVDRLWEAVAEQRIDSYSPPTPESHGSSESVASNWPNYGSSIPGSPTGSHTGPMGGRFSSPPGWSMNPGTLSSAGHQLMPPQSPTGGSPLPHPGPSEGRFPSTPGWSVNSGTLSSTGHQPTPPQSPMGSSPLPPLPHPGPSEGHFPSPPGFSANPDTLSSTDLWSQIMQLVEEEHHTYTGGPPPSLGSPVSLPGSDYYVLPSPGSPTGSRLPLGSIPLANSPSLRLPPLPYPSQPGPSEDRFLPGFSVNPNILSSTGHQPMPPQSPTGGSPLPHPGPSEGRFPSPPGFSANPTHCHQLICGRR